MNHTHHCIPKRPRLLARFRTKVGPLLAPLLLSFTPPGGPPATYKLETFGEPVVFMVPAFDPTLGVENGTTTHIAVDLVFRYSVYNPGPLPAYVQLCAPSSTQSVELLLDDGASIGFVTFPLTPVNLVVQPGGTAGPATVEVKNLSYISQSLLGAHPASYGPTGTDVKLLARFPRAVSTISNGCRVLQSLHVTARVRVHWD